MVDKNMVAFEFTRCYTPLGIQFYISVLERWTPYMFAVKERKEGWKIVDAPKVPQWIHDVEVQIADAICEFMKDNMKAE